MPETMTDQQAAWRAGIRYAAQQIATELELTGDHSWGFDAAKWYTAAAAARALADNANNCAPDRPLTGSP
jgi:hypothetical protein